MLKLLIQTNRFVWRTSIPLLLCLIALLSTYTSNSQSITINEVSQGTSGSQEYVEFLVTGPDLVNCDDTPPCIDLRLWVFDDNNGNLNTGGAQSGVGIAGGACRFADDPFWSCIPAGTIIVIYNDSDPNGGLPADDVSMSDNNCALVVPISSSLFDHHPSEPSSSNSTYPTTGWVNGGNWTDISMANGGDGFQIYDPADMNNPVHSVGWDENDLADIYFTNSSMSGDVIYSTDCNYFNQGSWVVGSASSDQTPGAPNNTTQADCIGKMNANCNPPTMTLSAIAETCAGYCDGSASATITGGTSPYSLTWSPAPGSGQGTANISGLCSDTYILTLVDDGGTGCTLVDSVVVPAGPACCTMTNFTATIGACDATTNSYTTTGTVEFTGAPSTGQLIVEDCNGNQDVFNAPFTSPINYTISGQSPDGLTCNVTAYFSDAPTCTQTINYTAPICPCNIDTFNVVIGTCDQVTNTYQLNGEVYFTSPPTTGDLVVEVDNGTTTYDTIINTPFSSPQVWSVSGIPADGAASTVTVYFSDDPACSSTISYTAPADCSCSAEIGTFTATISGSSTNNYVLCYGDQIDIVPNGDYTPPDEQFSPPGPTYDPGVSWLMYSCPPTVGLTPQAGVDVTTDPCFLGLVSHDNFTDVNDMSWINAYPQGTFTNNTIYWVPITMYSQVDGMYSYVNGTIPCYELGPPFAVQYLPEFSSTYIEDCITGEAVITLNGGLPAIDGSDFTVSNLQPSSASFSNTTATDGGTITITGLQGGDNWSFDVVDGNGCPYTVIGGPFPPLEDPGFNYAQTSWCTAELPMTPTITGVPGGSFTSTPAGLSLDPGTGEITPSTSLAGTYDVTYTTPGTCFDDSTITVNISVTPSVDPIADQTICEGTNFTDIIFTGSAGSTFDWTNDNINTGLASSGSGDILSFAGTTPFGVQEVSNITVTPVAGSCTGSPTGFTLTVNPIDDPSFNYAQTSWCTSESAMTPTITGTIGGAFSSIPAGLTLDANTGQITPATSTPGTYDVTYTTSGVCPDDLTITVNVAATPSVNPVSDQTVCDGNSFTLIDFTGSAGSTFNWTNDNTNIGLSASGFGDINAFIGTAPSVQEIANITVTPVAGSCTGTSESFILTVNPNDDASFSYSQSNWCTTDANSTPLISGTTGGTFSSTPAGLTLNSATGEITPSTSSTGTYDITYTTSGVCPDDSTITVNIVATPSVDPVADQTVCEGTDFAFIDFTGSAGSTFDWTNDNTNIGLGASGTGDINVFTGTTPSGIQEVATVTVTPSAGSCVGTAETFTLTVNPQEDPGFNYAQNAWCTTDASMTPNITGVTGGSFSSTPAGLSLNTTTGEITPGTSTAGAYDVTYTSPGPNCPNDSTITIDIHQTPVVDPILDQTVCAGDNFDGTQMQFTGPYAGTTFDWTNDNTNIGLGALGTGNISAFAGITPSGVQEVATITVTPSNANCTGTAETFTLTVNPLDDPSWNYPNGLTYCQTGTDPVANISGMPGGTFGYIVASGGPALTLNNTTGEVDLGLSDTGVYNIVYTTSGVCPQDSTLTLNIIDSPIPDFVLGEYCINDNNDPLPTFINGGTSGVFSASPNGLSINSSTGQVDLSASSPGTYTVINFIDGSITGCTDTTHDTTIVIHDIPNATISSDAIICPGDDIPNIDVIINGNPGPWEIEYTINGNTQGVISTSSTIDSIVTTMIGTYETQLITDQTTGCEATLSGQVVIDTFTSPQLIGLVDQSICHDELLSINDFDATLAGTTFDWVNVSGTDIGFGTGGLGNIGSFTGDNTSTLPISVTIEVTPTSTDGCEGPTEDFLVTVNPLPEVSFTGPAAGCEPLMVTFNNTTSQQGQSCYWDFGDGNTTTGCGSVTHTFYAGLYDVSLTVTTAHGCSTTESYVDFVDVTPEPEASFTYTPQEIDVENTEVSFTNNSIDASSYEWDFGDESPIMTIENPTHTYPDVSESYTVTLWAYSDNGICYDSIQQLVNIKDVLIYYVPNVFTPDGDEFNETFQPIFTSGYDPFDYHLTIFNRWGEIIFESYNTKKGWNGHYGDGGLVQDGVYVWQIEFKESMSDKRHTVRGHVTVLK